MDRQVGYLDTGIGIQIARFAVIPILIVLSGCAALPQFGEPPLAGPPAPSQPVVRPSDDPAPEVPDPDTWARVPEEKPKAPTLRKGVVEADASEGPPDSLAAQIQPTLPPAEPPPVTVSLPQKEQQRRETKARGELTEARRLIRGLDSGNLAGSEQEKLRTIRGLIEKAETALTSDIQAAEGLARKARLLALELSSQ